MSLEAYLDEKREIVDQALDQALPQGAGFSANLSKAMRYSLLAGGKRLRPILCLAGAEAVGGEPEIAMPAALALEMIHTYSLIHDDLPVMDDDDLRRGRPTCHKVFGEALAVLAGDGLLTEGFRVLARAGRSNRVESGRILAALEVIASAAGPEGMVAGQTADLESEGRAVDEDAVRFIHFNKTAALISASVASGAILGGGTEEQIHALERYGRHTGLAFQIMDDILDVEGDANQMGKSTGMDSIHDKATYPKVIGLEKSREAAEDQVRRAVDSLNGFGPEADPLRKIAAYFITRRK